MSRAAYHREWRAKNPDKVKAAVKRRYAKHRKRLIAEAVAWNKKNPMKRWKYSREYLMRNRKKILARKKKYYHKNKYKLKLKRVLGVKL